jgi:hypothetical protein
MLLSNQEPGTTSPVRPDDIQPLHQLSSAMAAHFRARYGAEAIENRVVDALFESWTSTREVLDRLEG